MKTIIKVGLTGLLFFTAFAHAQPLGDTAPDFSAGKKRAEVCFACHNVDGIAKIPGTPHLAGQERSYLESALHAYRDGLTRQNPTMNAMAKPLSDSDIANIAAYFSLQTRMNNGQTAAETIATMRRVQPEGRVQVQAASQQVDEAKTAKSGETVYQTTCAACHSTGAIGAPKLGDSVAWKARTAQGMDVLYKHALTGLNAMPPRGTCANCTDEEIKRAVDYMVKQN